MIGTLGTPMRLAFSLVIALSFVGLENASMPAANGSPATAPPVTVQASDWTTQADSQHGQIGQRFTLVCPANGTLSSRLWGTDLYTDDSSICTAAVHAGLITAGAGGTVTIEIKGGATSYTGSTRNGVTSHDYGAWTRSFAIISSTKGAPAVSQVPVKVASPDWTTQANSQHGQVGQRFKLTCPANGTISSRLWGTDLYTDDSSICTAAVHAGLISTSAGGTVTIEIRPGAASYRGSTRHGVTSKDYGAWNGSFKFVR